MKFFLLSLLIIISTVKPLFSQNQNRVKIDSLLAELKTAKEDTIKVKLLNGLGYTFRNIDADSGLAFSKSALDLAQKLKWNPGIANAYLYTGMNYMRISKPDQTLEYFEKSLSIYSGLKDEKGITIVLGNLGNAYKMLNLYPQSFDCYFKVLKKYEEQGDSAKMGVVLGNIGINYSDMGEYSKSLDYLKKALVIHERLGEKNDIGRVLNVMGGVYGYLEQPNKALDLYKKAMIAWQESGNEYGYASVLGNIGIVYDDLGQYDKSIEYNKKALELNKELGSEYSVAHNLKSLGTSYSKASDEVLKKFLIKPTERYTKAIEVIRQAITISKKIESMSMEEECWLVLTDVYVKQNKYKEAFESQKQYLSIHDSLFKYNQKDEITKKELQYDYEKKQTAIKTEQDKKDALAILEIQRQKDLRNNFAAIGVVVLVMSFVSLLFYKRKRDAQQNQLTAEQKEKETASTLRIKETELKALRLQMNPHFIDNALQSIQYFLNEHKANEAEEYLVKFSNLMRAVLMNSERDEIPLSKELEVLEWYMQLENLRMNYPFNYEFHIDKDIDIQNTSLPPNILQPFVENSIKHGLLPKGSPGKISIYIDKKEEDLHVIIEDNGVGRNTNIHKDQPVLLKRESLGIKITQDRLNILNQSKNSTALLKIVDLINNNKATGTRVEINLPYLS